MANRKIAAPHIVVLHWLLFVGFLGRLGILGPRSLVISPPSRSDRSQFPLMVDFSLPDRRIKVLGRTIARIYYSDV